MCGICGIVHFGAPAPDLDATVARMRATLTHRGPDGQGGWRSEDRCAVFGHTRLAIVDPGPGGMQPMTSADGRWTVTYNGEIYNHRALRSELNAAGAVLRSSSDTEILLELIAGVGMRGALERSAGMFAFAAFDSHLGQLHLVRDRLGKKPLYVAARGHAVAFASELRGLLAWPALAAAIEPEAVADFLAYGYVRGARSILRGVFRLPPAHHLVLACATDAEPGRARCYWEASQLLEHNASPASGEYAEQLIAQTLSAAVAERMVADVPVGALLSGGIDSSLVVALMQQHANRPVRTFSIGFGQRDYDEAVHAAAVARHLGTQHSELYVTPQAALDAVQDLSTVFDEPFADSSQIPSLLVARLTREHVKVALTGDGGDEVFGGYNRHVNARGLETLVARVPHALRRAGAAAAVLVPPRAVDIAARVVRPGAAVLQGAGDRAHRLAWLCAARDGEDLYDRLLRLPERGLGRCQPDIAPHVSQALQSRSPAERYMFRDTQGYLCDDILVKMDRTSMSCGLELRSPLLDHRVLSAAWRLHTHERTYRGQGKRVLRRLLAQHVPAALFERPKAGFAAPLHEWLRGPLKDWAVELLEPAALAADGFVDARRAALAWSDHQTGRRNLQHMLWPVLMLRAWRLRWGL